jgi:hypothetical protein
LQGAAAQSLQGRNTMLGLDSVKIPAVVTEGTRDKSNLRR